MNTVRPTQLLNLMTIPLCFHSSGGLCDEFSTLKNISQDAKNDKRSNELVFVHMKWIGLKRFSSSLHIGYHWLRQPTGLGVLGLPQLGDYGCCHEMGILPHLVVDDLWCECAAASALCPVPCAQ